MSDIPKDILRAAEAAFHAAWDAGHSGPVALALFAERQANVLKENPLLAQREARSGNTGKSHVPGEKDNCTNGIGNDPVSRRVGQKSPPAGLVIYCDGACEPNPGVGGWGFVVYRDGVEIHSDHGGNRRTTNNIMEMTGALMALRWFADRQVVEPVRLLCDSQYVVKGCNEWRAGWKRKGWRRGVEKELANADLWRELDQALTLVPITLEWVKGHAGIVGNERADELSLMGRESALAEPASMRMIREQLDYSARGGM